MNNKISFDKKNLDKNYNYNINKEFDVINKKYLNIDNEINKCIKIYDIKINKEINHLDNYFQIYKAKISGIENDFNNIKKLRFSSVICNILKVDIQNHINNDENYSILDINNKNDLFIQLYEKYKKILDNNLNHLLNSNENSLIIKFFLNNIEFTNNNFIYKIPKINIIHDILFLLNLKNYDKKSVDFSTFNESNLKENSELIYNKLKDNSDKLKFLFDINTFEAYERKYNKSNIFLNEKKDELYQNLNKKIDKIVNLEFFNFNINLFDIINDKQKYINFVNEKEKYISKNLSDYKDFSKLYQFYSTIKKNIELNIKELETLESHIIELDNFFISDEIINLDKNYIVNKKKLQLHKLKKYSLKINNLEDNNDLIKFNNNDIFLNKQIKKLNEYKQKDKELIKKISINKNKIIILNQNIKKNKTNTIKINKYNKEISFLEKELKQYELELNDIKYEIIYMKKNINTVSQKKDLLEKKKIISENLINKINSSINNINKQSERTLLDYQVSKKNLDDNYELTKNKLNKNKKLYKTLLLDIKNKKIELRKLNFDFSHYKSILNDNYNEFFIIKNNIVKVVNLLLEIEKIYIEYNSILEKINNNSSLSFLEKYYDKYEQKYINYFKNYTFNCNSDFNSNKFEILTIFYKVLNFYNNNYYYIYHLHVFNVILNKNYSFENKIKINKIEYEYYKNILDRLISDCETILNKKVKTEISELNKFIRNNIDNINRNNLVKNKLLIMYRSLKNCEMVKINKYLNDIK